MAARRLPANTPVVMVGHSRGAKIAVRAASLRRAPKVTAMVLLDPVDSTSFEPLSVLPLLESLRIPTAVVGAGNGADCAPVGANYDAFLAALTQGGAVRLLGIIQNAGHLQFVDRRRDTSDVCTYGKLKDDKVRGVAQAVLAVWCAAFVPGVAHRLVEGTESVVGSEIVGSEANPTVEQALALGIARDSISARSDGAALAKSLRVLEERSADMSAFVRWTIAAASTGPATLL